MSKRVPHMEIPCYITFLLTCYFIITNVKVAFLIPLHLPSQTVLPFSVLPVKLAPDIRSFLR